MTEEQLYDEAFQQMSSAPLELDETQPPRRRRAPGAGRKRKGRVDHVISFDPATLEKLDAYADAHTKGNRSEANNQLLAKMLAE